MIKEERTEYMRRWRANHRDYERQRHKKRKVVIRDFLNKAKNVPCFDCKKAYPYYVMDFDHMRDKKFNLSDAICGYKSIRKIEEEIKKCQIVCSNCHRIRTHAGNKAIEQ